MSRRLFFLIWNEKTLEIPTFYKKQNYLMLDYSYEDNSTNYCKMLKYCGNKNS